MTNINNQLSKLKHRLGVLKATSLTLLACGFILTIPGLLDLDYESQPEYIEGILLEIDGAIHRRKVRAIRWGNFESLAEITDSRTGEIVDLIEISEYDGQQRYDIEPQFQAFALVQAAMYFGDHEAAQTLLSNVKLPDINNYYLQRQLLGIEMMLDHQITNAEFVDEFTAQSTVLASQQSGGLAHLRYFGMVLLIVLVPCTLCLIFVYRNIETIRAYLPKRQIPAKRAKSA